MYRIDYSCIELIIYSYIIQIRIPAAGDLKESDRIKVAESVKIFINQLILSINFCSLITFY